MSNLRSVRSRFIPALVLIAGLALPGTGAAAPLAAPIQQTPNATDAAATPFIHFQGRLVEPATGKAKADGFYTMVFSLYAASSGGSPLWSEQQSVEVRGGLFTAQLGAATALSLTHFDGQNLWLGVKVGDDAEALPRQLVGTVPYAFFSQNADQLDGKTSADFAAASHSHDGGAITSGTVADARLDAALARDIEIMSLVFAGDGAGSGLDADKLDGKESTAFANSSHNHLGQTWTWSTNATALSLSGSVSWSNGMLKVTNGSNGPAVWGVNSGGGNAVRGDGYGLGIAVYGEGDLSYGVAGRDGGANPDDTYAVYGFGDIYTTDDLYVSDDLIVYGDATFAGGKTGYVVDIARNDDSVALESGDVVITSGVHPPILGDIPVIGVRRAAAAESRAVVGVVDRRYVPATPEVAAAGQAAAKADALQSETAIAPGDYLTVVTLGAFRGVKVDAAFGAVAPGDLLVASPHAGYAMRTDDPPAGSVVGKALAGQASGTGFVPVLVTLQ